MIKSISQAVCLIVLLLLFIVNGLAAQSHLPAERWQKVAENKSAKNLFALSYGKGEWDEAKFGEPKKGGLLAAGSLGFADGLQQHTLRQKLLNQGFCPIGRDVLQSVGRRGWPLILSLSKQNLLPPYGRTASNVCTSATMSISLTAVFEFRIRPTRKDKLITQSRWIGA